MLDVEEQDHRAAGTEQPLRLAQYLLGVLDMIEGAAGHDHVDALADERNSLGADRQVHGARIREHQAVLGIPLC